ncbi:MAG: hypothetical protein J5582_10380 [Ruminococcus sp.]|uniref:hypothetical protein n=1 Tax=Ruminococcus sp. TaxID=41978 RepID=UPI0025E1D316|nr:hypothetical protein [Ruminococcus sp.]MBO4866947.1 hypothetical protein [Ruminococcus sp.]
MKRALYICEILTCAVFFAFICLHMRAFNEPICFGELGYFLSLAGYGISAVLLIKKLIDEFKTKAGRSSLKEVVFSTFYALPLLAVVLMAVVVFFTDNFSTEGILLILSMFLLFISANWFEGRSMYKLIGLFVVLTFLIVAAFVFCGVMRTPTPYGFSPSGHLKDGMTPEELQRYKVEDLTKAVGGAAQLCFIPAIFAFLLADIFSDDMIYENSKI